MEMRRALQLVLIFLASAVVTILIVGVYNGALPDLHLDGLSRVRIKLPSVQVGPPQRPHAAPGGAATVGVQARRLHARQLAAGGHDREAQDELLAIMHDNPGDTEAMQALIQVRRQLARGDAMVLRRQAAAYQDAVARGVDTPEHYSAAKLELLALACLQAAAAIEGQSIDSGRMGTAATPPAAAPSSPAPSTAPPGQPRATPGARRATQPPAPAPQTPLAPPTPSTQGPGAPPATPQSQSPPGPDAFPVVVAQPSAPPSPATPASPPQGSSEVVAVVTPPASTPLTKSEGSLVGVDCQRRAFVLRGPNGDEEYLTAPSVAIYIRGDESTRLKDFCGLRGFLGRTALTWSMADGDRRIARSISIIVSAHGGE